jgi:hypothetical protein
MAAMAPETGRNKPNDRHAVRITVVRGLDLKFILNSPLLKIQKKELLASDV